MPPHTIIGVGPPGEESERWHLRVWALVCGQVSLSYGCGSGQVLNKCCTHGARTRTWRQPLRDLSLPGLTSTCGARSRKPSVTRAATLNSSNELHSIQTITLKCYPVQVWFVYPGHVADIHQYAAFRPLPCVYEYRITNSKNGSQS